MFIYQWKATIFSFSEMKSEKISTCEFLRKLIFYGFSCNDLNDLVNLIKWQVEMINIAQEEWSKKCAKFQGMLLIKIKSLTHECSILTIKKIVVFTIYVKSQHFAT